jgi:hypothetical protein
MGENGSEVKLHKNFGAACACVCVENQHRISKLGLTRQETNNVKYSKL